MKKKVIKNLPLHKKTISRLNQKEKESIMGGQSIAGIYSWYNNDGKIMPCCDVNPLPPAPDPDPTPETVYPRCNSHYAQCPM